MCHPGCYFRLLAVLHSPTPLEGSCSGMTLPLQYTSRASVRFRPHPCHRHRPLPRCHWYHPGFDHSFDCRHRHRHRSYQHLFVELFLLLPIRPTNCCP
uniref:Putative secreted peptide n=1 Tax=Anopheles braziliensis TaxID=58242 RepID=A0A2M3ZRP2_9DIPT